VNHEQGIIVSMMASAQKDAAEACAAPENKGQANEACGIAANPVWRLPGKGSPKQAGGVICL